MKKTAVPILFVIGIAFSTHGLFAFITNQSADVVIGHHYFSQNGANGKDARENTFCSPAQVYCEGSGGARVFVADTDNHRVLIYNQPPADYDAVPDVVIGQPDFFGNRPNQGGEAGPNTLFSPRAVYTYGSMLLVSDSGNNRVLIYNSIPATNNAGADVVIGQADLQHQAPNQGGDVAANTLKNPGGICSYGSMLFIADTANHRVLKFDDIPGYDNRNASAVIGQPAKSTNQYNNGGLSGATLYLPEGIWVSGTRLMIADRWNNRVLIYNDVNQITADGRQADVVVGQPDMTHNNSNQGFIEPDFTTLCGPCSVYSNGSKLFIVDSGNQRVLIYPALPNSNNPAATCVVGQEDETMNDLLPPSSCTLTRPRSVFSRGDKMYIGDTGNHRVLIFNSIPESGGLGADVVLGQNDMTQNAPNQSAISGETLYSPGNAVKADGRLMVSDSGNNRVLIYDSVPASNGAQANWVIGQADMLSNAGNRGGENPSAATLYGPAGLCCTGNQLLVSDYSNHRVLIYDISHMQPDLKAGVVIGQPDMFHGKQNQGSSVSGQSLSFPKGICTDGARLFIADSGNSRVLIFRAIPQADHAVADLVIGQPDLTSGSANRGSDVGANTLYSPTAVGVSGSRLLISDYGNHRVLIFNSIPAALNASADVVIGQSSMTGNQMNQGGSVNGNTLRNPADFCIEKNRLFLSDYNNHRILIFNTLPDANNAAADSVIGQSFMSGSGSNQGAAPAPNTLSNPKGVFVDDSGLLIADTGNNRILEFLNPLPSTFTPTVAPDVAYQNDIRAFNSRFNPETGGQTHIRWHQSETARTTVKIYTLHGEWVKTLVNGETLSAGRLHEAVWNGLNTGGSVVASGIYIVHIEAGRYQESIKVAVVK